MSLVRSELRTAVDLAGRYAKEAAEKGEAYHAVQYQILQKRITALLGEAEKLLEAETLLHLAGPALRAGVTYHQKTAHAAHALPGSREREGYASEADEALWKLRLDSSQKGAAAVLDALAAMQGGES